MKNWEQFCRDAREDNDFKNALRFNEGLRDLLEDDSTRDFVFLSYQMFRVNLSEQFFASPALLGKALVHCAANFNTTVVVFGLMEQLKKEWGTTTVNWERWGLQAP